MKLEIILLWGVEVSDLVMFFRAVGDVRAFVVWICKMQISKNSRKPNSEFVLLWLFFFKWEKHWKFNSYIPEIKMIITDKLLPSSLKNSLILVCSLICSVYPLWIIGQICCLAQEDLFSNFFSHEEPWSLTKMLAIIELLVKHFIHHLYQYSGLDNKLLSWVFPVNYTFAWMCKFCS